MASKAPPIPPDQRSAPDEKPHVKGSDVDRRSRDHLNLKEQGRAGNIHQNTHNQGYQQDR
ncbi:MAG TPA: hypothetical protein VLI41_12385 [Phenylobacterium sp.]|uniref:hypothetical protein n=1 Tax=Phenylobacterium sp. TaxID=1871053 RepID=UPI002C7A6F42|nr:hypothetical protein [Phenylobacterium sp.]HSV03992.1 hypothetical protein [Phenylobacterium sp.]